MPNPSCKKCGGEVSPSNNYFLWGACYQALKEGTNPYRRLRQALNSNFYSSRAHHFTPMENCSGKHLTLNQIERKDHPDQKTAQQALEIIIKLEGKMGKLTSLENHWESITNYKKRRLH